MLQARKRHSCSDSSKKFFHYGETKRVIYMQDTNLTQVVQLIDEWRIENHF